MAKYFHQRGACAHRRAENGSQLGHGVRRVARDCFWFRFALATRASEIASQIDCSDKMAVDQ